MAAFIPAAASVVGGAIGSVSSKHAANQQAKATEAALQFEREREATRKQEFAAQQAQAKAAWDAYQTQLQPFRNITAQTLAKYGYKGALNTLGNLGGGSGPMAMAPQGAYGAPRAQTGIRPQGADVRAMGGGRTLADIYRDLQIQNPNLRSDLAYNQNMREI